MPRYVVAILQSGETKIVQELVREVTPLRALYLHTSYNNVFKEAFFFAKFEHLKEANEEDIAAGVAEEWDDKVCILNLDTTTADLLNPGN